MEQSSGIKHQCKPLDYHNSKRTQYAQIEIAYYTHWSDRKPHWHRLDGGAVQELHIFACPYCGNGLPTRNQVTIS